MPLPCRRDRKIPPSSLPKEFLQTVGTLFTKQFKKNLSGSTFLVYGDLYTDEVILCVSLAHKDSLQAASMHLSMDLPKNMGKIRKK